MAAPFHGQVTFLSLLEPAVMAATLPEHHSALAHPTGFEPVTSAFGGQGIAIAQGS